MKNFFLLFLLFFISAQIISAQDLIVKHDGDKLDVKVNYITESIIVFTEPGASTSKKLGKAEVEKIIYKSGRVEPISEKVVVHGVKDWAKIIVTTNPLSVIGLVKKGEIHVKPSATKGGVANLENKEVEKMKKQAAEMGAHVIVLSGYDARLETVAKNSEQIIVAYGYEK